MANRDTTTAGGGANRGGTGHGGSKHGGSKHGTEHGGTEHGTEHGGMEKAKDLGHKAADKARSRADQQKDRVSEGVRSMAGALRRGGRELSDDHQQYGSFLNTVADRAEDLSRYLDEHDVNTLTRDARQAARNHAPVFLSGAFTLGMLGARFIKSSGDKSGRGTGSGRSEEGPWEPYTPGRRGGTGRYTSPSAEYDPYEPEELYTGPPHGQTRGRETGELGRRTMGDTSAESRSAESRSAKTRSAETRSADTRSAESRSAESRSTESGSTEPRRGNREGGSHEPR